MNMNQVLGSTLPTSANFSDSSNWEWILDGGAMDHMLGNQHCLINIYSGSLNIQIIDGSSISIN